jgi:ribosomal protein S18 acetylase RimI-like enzyme
MIDIRPIAQQDKPRWAALWYAYLDFYDTTVPGSVYDATFSAVLEDRTGAVQGRLAWIDGEAVGLVHFLHHAHAWRPEGAVYMQDLFAQPELRGRGIGRALIEAVYAHADSMGVPYVYWTTRDSNRRARSLYDKLGTRTDFIKYVRPE